MPIKRPDPRTQEHRGMPVDELVSQRAGLFTYALAAERLQLSSETIRRYCDTERLSRVYLDVLPMVTKESLREFEKTAIRYKRKNRQKSV